MATMRCRPARWARALLLVLALVAVACAGTAQPAAPGTPAPAKPSGASVGAGGAPASASSAPAAPAAAPDAAWEQLVAAARQEGQLDLSAPPGDLWRRALSTFEQDYPGIRLQLTGVNSRDFWPRVFLERQSGQYLWDLRVGGPDQDSYNAVKDGAFEPVRPLLVHPAVVDDSKWLTGLDGLFVDAERRYFPGFVADAQSTFFVNRDVVPEAELRSDLDLLDPRWKGKIALMDPRGGAGQGRLTVMLAARGEDYVRDLLTKQDVVVTGNNRQLAEWIVRGQYPIGVGVSDALKEFQLQGLGLNVKRLEEGPVSMSPGFGGIQLLSRAPHPNAAKLFINWLLTPEVQTRVAQTVGVNSRRVDVPPGDPTTVPDRARL